MSEPSDTVLQQLAAQLMAGSNQPLPNTLRHWVVTADDLERWGVPAFRGKIIISFEWQIGPEPVNLGPDDSVATAAKYEIHRETAPIDDKRLDGTE
jgi:hypothetical protein